MSASSKPLTWNRIFLDINTQCDFLLPKGALPVANRRELLPNIRKLMNWARLQRFPVISSLEAHRAGEAVRGLPSHCVDRTNGQKKLPFTLLPRRIMLFGDNTIDVPHEVFRRFQQVIFTKRDRDFFTNPKADRLVNALDVNHFVVFGVVAEYCVKAAVLGLLTRRQRVAVVTDACGYWSAGDRELAMRQLDAKGAILVTTDQLISGQADECIRNTKRPMPYMEEVPVMESPWTFVHEATTEEISAKAQLHGHSGRNGRNGAGQPSKSNPLSDTDLLKAKLASRGLQQKKRPSSPGLA